MEKRDRLLKASRAAYARQDWADAHALLSETDSIAPLDAADLALLAWSAGMLDRDDEVIASFERMHDVHIAAGRQSEAAYAAFFAGFRHMAIGQMGQAGAWLQRAHAIVRDLGRECAAQGFLFLPVIHKCLAAGDNDGASAAAQNALAIGERCAEPDLIAFAHAFLGRALARKGQVSEGIGHLDEAMLLATGGRLSPVITGVVYCAVIETCRQVFAFDRAREWTEVLSDWTSAQPQLVQFNGLCLVHRAEIMELGGAWPEAVEEARRAAQNVARALAKDTASAAAYQQGEIHRLRGEFLEGEAAYVEASRLGREPQPGLALLRLAQGRADHAAAAIRASLTAVADPLARARLLPAAVEILVAIGAHLEARTAAAELLETSRLYATEVIAALADEACGLIDLSQGDAGPALARFRSAFAVWQRLEAPYVAARVRVRAGLACRALGDEEGARLDFAAARQVFDQLGAAPDAASLDTLGQPARPPARNGLTRREMEVLAMVATGKTNKAIAMELDLSEKTIDRHVSNIFGKIDVESRTAAAAYAFQHQLI